MTSIVIIIIHLKISLKIKSTKIERERKGKRDLMKLAVINIKTVKTSMHIYAYICIHTMFRLKTVQYAEMYKDKLISC